MRTDSTGRAHCQFQVWVWPLGADPSSMTTLSFRWANPQAFVTKPVTLLI